MKRLTSTQHRIIGYLMSAGGSPAGGSSIKEISDATTIPQSTIYTQLRMNLPGVMQCESIGLYGTRMYYLNHKALSEDIVTEVKSSAVSAVVNPNGSTPNSTAPTNGSTKLDIEITARATRLVDAEHKKDPKSNVKWWQDMAKRLRDQLNEDGVARDVTSILAQCEAIRVFGIEVFTKKWDEANEANEANESN